MVMRGIGVTLCALLGVLSGGATAEAYPSTPSGWAALFAGLPMSGDGMVSVKLDSSRVAFLTGDSIPRAGGQWAHSTITVVSGSTATMMQPNYPNLNPYQVINETGEVYHWLGPAAAPGNNRIYVLAPKVKSTPGVWPGFASVGMDVAVFSYTATTGPVFMTFVPAPSGGPVAMEWSGGFVAKGSTLYAFGVTKDATDGWTGRDVYVARISSFDVASGAWKYGHADALGVMQWSSDAGTAAPILRSSVDGGVENSFSATWNGTGWKLASRHGGRWGPGQVTEWSTPVLGSPWLQTTIATVPNDDPSTPENEGAYLAWKHYAVPALPSGQRLMTYNVEGHDAVWASVP